MRTSSIFPHGLIFVAGFLLVRPALATVNMVYVPVGDVGNTADASTGYGAVSYAYNIGKYEVTNAQYADFLKAKGASNSAGIYYSGMASYGINQSGSSGSYTYSVTSGYENMPAVYVTWFDAARFCNWLGNGQGSASMETGAYTLISGQTSGIVTVNPGASIYIPSEDEWYKAAYYNGGNSTYSLYPNGKNTITTAEANYGSFGGHSTAVGSYGGDPSYYGTFDQGGNVWEWNDAVVNDTRRAMRGGSWTGTQSFLSSSFRSYDAPTTESNGLGFRVASVPEPTSVVLAIFGSGTLLIRRKR